MQASEGLREAVVIARETDLNAGPAWRDPFRCRSLGEGDALGNFGQWSWPDVPTNLFNPDPHRHCRYRTIRRAVRAFANSLERVREFRIRQQLVISQRAQKCFQGALV
jgi:hypothetical protein